LVNTRGHIVGIDKVIEPVKQDMYDFLKTTWAGDIQGYGRVYRNENDGESPVPNGSILKKESMNLYIIMTNSLLIFSLLTIRLTKQQMSLCLMQR